MAGTDPSLSKHKLWQHSPHSLIQNKDRSRPGRDFAPLIGTGGPNFADIRQAAQTLSVNFGEAEVLRGGHRRVFAGDDP